MILDKHDSTQRQALLKWVEGVVKKHVPDPPKQSFGALSATCRRMHLQTSISRKKFVINKYVVSSPYYYNWKDDVVPAATINLVAA